MAAARYREADYFVDRNVAASRDSPRALFENIPTGSPTRPSNTGSHFVNGGYGDPEAITYGPYSPNGEPRASRQWSEGTNPYSMEASWPMRPPSNDPQEWPMKSPTGGPLVPIPPPKIPSTSFEIQTEDTVLPPRPWANKSRSSFSSTEHIENAGSIRPVPSMNSMTTVRPALHPHMPERPATSTSSGSSPSIRSPAIPSVPSLDNVRPTSNTSLPPSRATATTPGGRVIVPPIPSPSLLSSSSSESGQSQSPVLNASIRPVTSARPFLNTHVRPLSPEGSRSDRTPIVEAGFRSPRNSNLDFPSAQSQASASPPPSSPPPPYSNFHPAPRRRTNSYYAFAQERSDQIMARSSPPPMPTHPAFRHSTPSSAPSPPQVNRATILHSRSAASLPIEEPRPLSAALTDSSNMTDETMDSATQSVHPASISVGTASPQPSSSSYPGARQYRPSSAASAPSEESRSRTSSLSSLYSTAITHPRSYSMATIMAEENVDDLDLRAVESAPSGIRRKPVPSRRSITDTYKEAVVQDPAFDTLKEVASHSANGKRSNRKSRETDVDANIVQRPRPRDMRKRLTDTSKEIVIPESELMLATDAGPSSPPPPLLSRGQVIDTSKEIVPDSPIEPEIQNIPPPAPTSQAQMIRQRNAERRGQGRGRRLRIVNA